MKYASILIVTILLSGCVAVTMEETQSVQKPVVPKRKLIDLDRISVGMTTEEVSNTLGNRVKIGYEENLRVKGALEVITVKNPYRSEELSIGENKYKVLYYLTAVNKPDDIVAEDEMTPLVFQDGKLTGYGWDYFFELKNIP